jgi:hypothetical protein
MRSELDITAARINRAIQEIAGAPA